MIKALWRCLVGPRVEWQVRDARADEHGAMYVAERVEVW